MKGNKGFINNAKSGAKALPARLRQTAAKTRLDRRRPPRTDTPPPARRTPGRETSMSPIKVERQPAEQRLEELGVRGWSIWTKEVSTFPWSYDDSETCYFLEGEAVITPDGGKPVHIARGDLVTFPAGMRCTWDVRSAVRKHYRFG